MITTNPHYDYSEPTMLHRVSRENSDLRALCTGVAEELERLYTLRPDLVEVLQPGAMRIRKRLFEAGAR
jgi:hypothetical protein